MHEDGSHDTDMASVIWLLTGRTPPQQLVRASLERRRAPTLYSCVEYFSRQTALT